MKQKIAMILLLLSLIIASVVPTVSAQEANVCSMGAGEQVATAFVNDLGYDITSHWVDFECQEGEGSLIAAGETYPAGTYDGHEFIFRDANGEFLGWYLSSTADNEQEVLVSSRFGQTPEWMNESIIDSEPEIIEEPETTVQTIITLIPIDESILPTEACSAGEGIEVNLLRIWNDTGTDNEIYLYWLNEECQEEELYLYLDDHHYRFDVAYAGDDLVFRNVDGELLGYYQVGTEDSEQWVNLTDLINVEVTIIGGGSPVQSNDAYQSFISETINPQRAAAGKSDLGISSTLQAFAVNVVENVDPTTLPFLESYDDVNVYDAITPDYTQALVEELGLEGQISAVLLHNPNGLTHEQIIDVLSVSTSYEGWTDGEIESFAVYGSGDVFVLIASDQTGAVAEDDEEWATFEYEEPATTNTVVSTFDRAGDMTYRFEAQKDMLYVILYQSDEYDTYLYLDGPDGVEIASNDDSAGNLNSLIVFTAPENGTYTARLDSFEPGASGEYTVSLAQPDAEIRGAVAVNGPVTVDFDVVEGTGYILSLNSDEFDTFLKVLNTNGAEVAFNDDFGGSTNSFVFFVAPETATYSVVVDSYASSSAGRFSLLTGSFE